MDSMHNDGGDDKVYGMVQGETIDIRQRARSIDSCPRPKGESGKSDCKTAGGVYRNGLKAGSQCSLKTSAIDYELVIGHSGLSHALRFGRTPRKTRGVARGIGRDALL